MITFSITLRDCDVTHASRVFLNGGLDGKKCSVVNDQEFVHVMMLFVITLIIIWYFLTLDSPPPVHLPTLAGGVVIGWAVYYLLMKLAVRQYRARLGPMLEEKVTLADEGLIVESAGCRSVSSWERFQKLYEDEAMIILFMNGRRGYLFPQDLIPPRDFAAAATFLRNKIHPATS